MAETLVWRAARAVAPHLKIATLDAWVVALASPMASSGITTPRRIAAFLGQVAVESGGFTELAENFDYSAVRAAEVWPSHFASIADAEPYAHQPERLANRVYAGRDGNGDVASGDGWTFRGRGLIQLTGRSNYEAFAVAVHRTVAQAMLSVQTMQGAAAAACWFWSVRALNPHADAWDIPALTRRINGGASAYLQRQSLSVAALRALDVAPPAVGTSPEPDPDHSADALNARELAGNAPPSKTETGS